MEGKLTFLTLNTLKSDFVPFLEAFKRSLCFIPESPEGCTLEVEVGFIKEEAG
jgi:hypothetical protein